MDENIREVTGELHGSPVMAALVVSGGGTSVLSWLTGVPGATRTLLDGVVPYGWHAMVEYLGWRPVQYASRETAISLAAAAYSRALHFREDDAPVLGVSCTAAIASDRPKRGSHRAHVGVWRGDVVRTYSLRLRKGLRDRQGEEKVVGQLVLRGLAEAASISQEVVVELAADEEIVVEERAVDRPLERLLNGDVDSLMVYGPDVMVADPVFEAAVLPGSFNPLHHGHLGMARAAEARLGMSVLFEISVRNVDKPPLTISEIRARLRQFEGIGRRVVLSREPLYREKAALYSGNPFVVGYDTAARTLDPAYYDGDPARMREALSGIRDAGCRFLVAGRLVGSQFKIVGDLSIPAEFEDLFEGIPEEEFRVDLSSTELRRLGVDDASVR